MHHLFDTALSIISHHSKSTEQKVDETYRVGSVVMSRVSVLEHQFASLRSTLDLDFAIQQEANDWHENESNERFFVLTGLPPAPAKLSGGISFYMSFCFLFIVFY